MKTIAFFGHREIFNEQEVKNNLMALLKEIIPQGYSKILIGCHGDFDKIALHTCLEYKNYVDKNLKINIVLSSLSYLNKNEFGYNKVDYYKEKGCETIFYDIEEVYYKNRITFTNKKMVENSDLIISYVNINAYKSGAKKAIYYAKKLNKTIINLFEE